ncbi:MBL fold metallo-hydrolase [Chloroflexota bacterium]
MKVKWLGHASFMITSGTGTRIITDPYETKDTLAYGEIEETADIVTVSHGHGDHNNAAAVKGNPRVVKSTTEVEGIKFKGIPTYHDDAQGKNRGANTIFCHLGDLGHPLSGKEAAELGKIDVLLIPVGGFYTIDAATASRICDQLKPGVIIPMHFRNDKCTFPITGVDEFLKGKGNIVRSDTSEVEFKAGEFTADTQIIVLKPAL